MKIKNLNQLGIGHFIIPLLIVVAVAASGTGYLVASHADPLTVTGWSFVGSFPAQTGDNLPGGNLYACYKASNSTTTKLEDKIQLSTPIPNPSGNSNWYEAIELDTGTTATGGANGPSTKSTGFGWITQVDDLKVATKYPYLNAWQDVGDGTKGGSGQIGNVTKITSLDHC